MLISFALLISLVILFTFAMQFSSFFNKPYINAYHENADILELEVFLNAKRCGQITFSKTKVNILISPWAFFYKGSISVDEVVLKYENDQLVLFNRIQNKQILSIKCSRDIFDKANFYLAARQHKI